MDTERTGEKLITVAAVEIDESARSVENDKLQGFQISKIGFPG
jgi:hypothetical protein